MRRVALVFCILGLLGFAGGLVAPELDARDMGLEKAQVYFPNHVKFSHALLKGEYLIVHDDYKAATGEPCLFVYELETGESGEPVVAIHCRRVVRDRAQKTKFTTHQLTPSVYDVREIQFAGSTNAHILR